ncbi:hypothetical protein PCAR4_10049 [Paraburkholderia caribensis]|nr:hypothetical protein PCAR4_10049 [Paraburkholderia caribensis]
MASNDSFNPSFYLFVLANGDSLRLGCENGEGLRFIPRDAKRQPYGKQRGGNG